jgi:hypothetical protein
MRTLYVVTVVSNPLLWTSRIKLVKAATEKWLNEPNVHITLVECAYGDRIYQLEPLASDRLQHIKVKADTLLWNKENLFNIGINHLPGEAKYVATLDADIYWRKDNWAEDIINALNLYPAIQPWKTAYDLGPNDEHCSTFNSFAHQYHQGHHVVPKFGAGNTLTNYPYGYPHPGYAWAWRMDFLNHVGGLFEWGGVGAGDHHMALALIGKAEMSIPYTLYKNSYHNLLYAWETRANKYPGCKIGFIPNTIEHMFHGKKENRGYSHRWDMFVKYSFDPVFDIKRNRWGVLEFAGNKLQLEREWDRYLRARNEDINSL